MYHLEDVENQEESAHYNTTNNNEQLPSHSTGHAPSTQTHTICTEDKDTKKLLEELNAPSQIHIGKRTVPHKTVYVATDITNILRIFKAKNPIRVHRQPSSPADAPNHTDQHKLLEMKRQRSIEFRKRGNTGRRSNTSLNLYTHGRGDRGALIWAGIKYIVSFCCRRKVAPCDSSAS